MRVELAGLLTEIGMVPDDPPLVDGPEEMALREYDHLFAMLSEKTTGEASSSSD